MCQWIILFSVLVIAVATPHDIDECGPYCTGIEYECVNGSCVCAPGFINDYYHTSCVKCPDLGEKCYRVCCNSYSNASLQCWHGICQPCYDKQGNWICRDTIDQVLLVSTTQVVMGTALILGIIATLILLLKLCSTTSLRPLGNGSSEGSRLSIGSLQMYIEQRLRDAPPRYTRTSPHNVASATVPAAYHNSGFVHDINTIPPPPYTEVKNETNPNNTVHI